MGKLRFVVPLLVIGSCVITARANDIPTVNVNQGTAFGATGIRTPFRI